MDFFPSFSEFKDKLNKKQNQIVYTKFSADLDTPVSLMLKLVICKKYNPKKVKKGKMAKRK